MGPDVSIHQKPISSAFHNRAREKPISGVIIGL